MDFFPEVCNLSFTSSYYHLLVMIGIFFLFLGGFINLLFFILEYEPWGNHLFYFFSYIYIISCVDIEKFVPSHLTNRHQIYRPRVKCPTYGGFMVNCNAITSRTAPILAPNEPQLLHSLHSNDLSWCHVILFYFIFGTFTSTSLMPFGFSTSALAWFHLPLGKGLFFI